MPRWIRRSCALRLRIDSDRGRPVHHQLTAPDEISVFSSYNLTPIDANYKIVPWVNGYLLVLVSKNLEAKGGVPIS